MKILVCGGKGHHPKWDKLPYFWGKHRCMKGIPDAIISTSITAMKDTYSAIKQFPSTPLFCYNWDLYEWIKKDLNRSPKYDWNAYGELLSRAKEIWVPSECTKVKTKEWYGLDSHVILTSCIDWMDNVIPESKPFILCTLRYTPGNHWELLNEANKELNLPIIYTKHEISFEEYKEKVRTCRFQVAQCSELSTGGLSAIEGYALGKPFLTSDSPWNGAVDYFGDKAHYFKAGNVDSLRSSLQKLYSDTPLLNIEECRTWVRENYSNEKMLKEIYSRLEIKI